MWKCVSVLLLSFAIGCERSDGPSTVLARSSTSPLYVSSEIVDLGPQVRGAVAHGTFSVTNRGEQTIRDLAISTGCGCTQASISKSELAANETTQVSVSLDTSGRHGRFSVKLDLTGKRDSEILRQTVELAATAVPLDGIKIEPEQITGKVKPRAPFAMDLALRRIDGNADGFVVADVTGPSWLTANSKRIGAHWTVQLRGNVPDAAGSLVSELSLHLTIDGNTVVQKFPVNLEVDSPLVVRPTSIVKLVAHDKGSFSADVNLAMDGLYKIGQIVVSEISVIGGKVEVNIVDHPTGGSSTSMDGHKQLQIVGSFMSDEKPQPAAASSCRGTIVVRVDLPSLGTTQQLRIPFLFVKQPAS
jgi:hypothetical protein